MKYFIIIISLLFFINPIFSQNTYAPDKKIDDAFNELDDEISEINSDKSLDDTEKDLEEVINNSRKKTKEAFDFSNDEKRSDDTEDKNRRIKTIDNLESIMNKKYSKITLGRNYNFVKAVVWFSNFESRSSDEKNLIFLHGFLSPALTAKYTIYLFDEDSKSTDIFFILQNSKKRNVYEKIKKSFKKDFGEGSKLDENREILKGKYNSIEIYKKIFVG
ncbi:MAG TPA: hypothetical protein PLO89_12125, partial [Spirochaetota bacterium]|nr:hypothetical protein [Spirochaetota bacterium]